MSTMYSLTYGLFVLTASEDALDNGCIINTAIQQTSAPNRISVTVNKGNLTCDMIARTGLFNVSILSENAPFFLYQHFGFQSGRNAQKFAGQITRAENGVAYLSKYTCGYLSGRVVQSVDLGTHMLFIADVTEMKTLSDEKPVTYSYYQSNVKPKPEKKKGYVCRICGYVYEGESLPDDFICPLCKHGADDFEPTV